MQGLERRRNRYVFTTWEALYGHFSPHLPREAMLPAVRSAIAEFVSRAACGPAETQLQMVRKCELRLKRLLRVEAYLR